MTQFAQVIYRQTLCSGEVVITTQLSETSHSRDLCLNSTFDSTRKTMTHLSKSVLWRMAGFLRLEDDLHEVECPQGHARLTIEIKQVTFTNLQTFWRSW